MRNIYTHGCPKLAAMFFQGFLDKNFQSSLLDVLIWKSMDLFNKIPGLFPHTKFIPQLFQTLHDHDEKHGGNKYSDSDWLD